MRILLVPSKYLPSVGGLENAVAALATRFRRGGHEVQIVTNRYSRSLKPLQMIDSIPVWRYFFTSGLPKLTPAQIAKYPARLWAGVIANAGVQRVMRDFQPDIVNLHYIGHPTSYLLRAIRKQPTPLVISFHGDDIDVDIWQSPVRERRFHAAVAASSLITSNSQYLLNRAISCDARVKEKGRVVGNGFEPAFTVQHPGNLPDRYIFAAGRLVHKKGFDVLIEAMALDSPLKGMVLILAGDGPERDNLKLLADARGVRTRFLGNVEPEMVAGLMQRCTAFCLPSRHEAFGLVLAEAMSFGLPIAASSTGGILEVLEDGQLGYIFEPDNPRALAEALSYAVEFGPPSNPEILKQTAFTRFNWDTVARKYLNIFQECVAAAGTTD